MSDDITTPLDHSELHHRRRRRASHGRTSRARTPARGIARRVRPFIPWALALIAGVLVVTVPLYAFVFVGAVGVIALSRRFPHLVVVLVVVAFISAYGLFDEDTFLRVAGVFKFRDIVLVTAFIIMALNYKAIQERASPYIPIMAAFAFLIGLQMARSGFIVDDFVSAIQRGRMYLFYFLLFLPLAILKTPADVRNAWYALVGLALTGTGVLIVLFIYPEAVPETIRYKFDSRFGSDIVRFYVPGIELASVLLPIGAAYLILVRDRTAVLRWSIILLFAAIGALLNLYRTIWVRDVVAVGLVLAVLGKQVRHLRGDRMAAGIGVGVGVALSAALFLGGEDVGGYDYIVNRLSSAYEEVRYTEGTFRSRMHEADLRWQRYTKQPILGNGFIHASKGEEGGLIEGYGSFNTDSGWISLLSELGLVGAVWFAVFLYIVGKRLWMIYRTTASPLLNSLVVGTGAYIFASGVVAMFTLAIYQRPIYFLGPILLLGIIEVAYRLEREGYVLDTTGGPPVEAPDTGVIQPRAEEVVDARPAAPERYPHDPIPRKRKRRSRSTHA